MRRDHHDPTNCPECQQLAAKARLHEAMVDACDEAQVFGFNEQTALAIARYAHFGQKRRGGEGYIEHIHRVRELLAQWPPMWEKPKAPLAARVMATATLHDVIEDNREFTTEQLRNLSVPLGVTRSVVALSRVHCKRCRGKGREEDADLWHKVMNRIGGVIGWSLSDVTINELADAVVSIPELTKHCRKCNGSGWSDSYAEYLDRVKADPVAVTVKRADALDNLHDDPRSGMPKKYQWVLSELADTPGAFGETGVPTLRDGRMTYD
jgi:hypothetical protein